ncbi:MAG TPA: sulfotransferase [Solirubrobacteraceae bacterium]
MPPVAFCIGLSRTGTKSFGEAAESLGFSRVGWFDRSDELMRAWHEGRIDELLAVAEAFEILGDIPWALAYAELAQAFPDARFVLTRRSSVDVWLRSIIAHTNRSPPYWGHEAAYGAAMPAAAPAVYRRFYAEHLDHVREFFRGSDRLLEVCWETGSGWEDLCGLLGVGVPEGVPFPHSGALATRAAAIPPPSP